MVAPVRMAALWGVVPSVSVTVRLLRSNEETVAREPKRAA